MRMRFFGKMLLAAISVLAAAENAVMAAPNVSVVVPVLYSYSSSRPAEFNWTFTSANGQAPRIGQFACGSYWVAPAVGDTGVTITALTGKSGQNDLLSCDADPLTERHGLLNGVNNYGSYDAAENILGSLPKTYSPASGSCVSLVAAMQRNEAECGNVPSPRVRGEALDALCIVTIMPSPPANNGVDSIRPNFTGATKEFLTWSNFDLTRIPSHSFIPSRSVAEWTKVAQRWNASSEVFSLGYEATPSSNSFSVASEGGRGFRSILVHDEYSAGKATTLNDNIIGLFTPGNTLAEKKPALAALIAHGLDTYHARYNYGSAKRKAWASGAGQFLGQFAPTALAASLLTDSTKADVLKQAALTRFGTDPALQGPQELQQIKRGMSNQILWGDGHPMLGTGMVEADWRYWSDFSASKCYDNYVGSDTPDANLGKKTAADPYGYHDGPANKPGTAYMGVSFGGFRGFAAIMVLMPKFREVVNCDDPIEYADRVVRHGLWSWPDPVATIPPAEQDTCSLWWTVSGAPTWGIAWGANSNNARFAIEDGTTDGLGRFKNLHGTPCDITAGYECGLAKNNWTSITALYTGRRYDSGDTQAPSVPTNLAASGITASSVDLTWIASTDNVGVTGYKVYTNGVNPVTVTGTSTTIEGLAASTTYSFSVSAHDAAGNNSSKSTAIQAKTVSGGGGDWISADIGGPTPAGSNSLNDGTHTIIAGGSELWGTSDKFRFVYKTLAGDGTMTARIDRLDWSNGTAKGGIMIRNTLDANSAHAFIYTVPSGGITFSRRLTAGASTGANGSFAGVTAPYWVRLTRAGNSFTAFRSPDGSTWTQVGTAQTVTMNSNVYIGMAVTSRNTSATTTAEFSNVTGPLMAEVANRRVVYKNSKFDNNGAGAEDNAVVPNKQALLPGQTATFANYTSYSRGINCIVVDVTNLAGTVSAADFTFKVGNSNTPNTWTTAPVPQSVTQRPGPNGSTRISIVWANNAIQKQWLQVTLKANANTGLSADDVFYFGNAIGEAGDSPANALVNPSDEYLTRINPRTLLNPAPIDFAYDFDRDGLVNPSDGYIARINPATLVTAIKLITVP